VIDEEVDGENVGEVDVVTDADRASETSPAAVVERGNEEDEEEEEEGDENGDDDDDEEEEVVFELPSVALSSTTNNGSEEDEGKGVPALAQATCGPRRHPSWIRRLPEGAMIGSKSNDDK